MTPRPFPFVSAYLVLALAGCAGKTFSSDSGGEGGASGATGHSGSATSGSVASGSVASGDATSGSASTSGGASSGEGASGGSGSSAHEAGTDGATCVNTDLSIYDRSCQQSADCVSIANRAVCSGYDCVCAGGAAINVAGLASYRAALASVHPGTGPVCNCPASPVPQCLGGVCTPCTGLRSDPPACHSIADAGPDGSMCVQVDLTTYDQSCETVSDCMSVTEGVLCPDSCACGGAAVNISEALRYQEALLARGSSIACPCAAPRPITCIENKCVLCPLGPQGPVCPDPE